MKKTAVILFAAAALAGCKGKNGAGDVQQDNRVLTKTETAEFATVQLTEEFTSEIEPFRENDITPAASGVHIDRIYVEVGDPVREGHLFMGWFADKQLTQPWDFSTPIADNMTLYAKWGEDVSSGGGVKPPINPDELNPSVPEGNVGGQAPIVTVVPTYTVVTTNAPLSDVKKEAAASVAEDGKATSATAKNATGAPKAKEAAPAAASAEPEPAPATLNPLAIAGIALGVVALLGVILYFVFARRRAQM